MGAQSLEPTVTRAREVDNAQRAAMQIIQRKRQISSAREKTGHSLLPCHCSRRECSKKRKPSRVVLSYPSDWGRCQHSDDGRLSNDKSAKGLFVLTAEQESKKYSPT